MKLGIFREVVYYMKFRKRFWLAPILFVLIILSVFIFLAEGSPLAPFIYALF